jgi:hypothetical protein
MPMKKYKPEQIVTLLRQVEVELANGKTTSASRSRSALWIIWSKKVPNGIAHDLSGGELLPEPGLPIIRRDPNFTRARHDPAVLRIGKFYAGDVAGQRLSG